MGMVVMKKRFEAPPSKQEILDLMIGDNLGDKNRAKDALINFLAPMKDLLALLSYVETLDTAAGQYADLLKEQELVKKTINGLKEQAETLNQNVAQAIAQAQTDHETAQSTLAQINSEIAGLIKTKETLSKQIEDEETAKIRVNKAISDEYDKLKAGMLAKVADEEKSAREILEALKGSINGARAELNDLAEKKRQFIASLGG